ncbi:unnamed protein product [Phyllotreta striolata]|uniref:Uncharacterized protein n=1 Tax=Phyllotreta striolata TaxID=444603 RepID=A0A9N9XLP1_PHYSR|nr:unnamed protein product [Phyllotreta striolata]
MDNSTRPTCTMDKRNELTPLLRLQRPVPFLQPASGQTAAISTRQTVFDEARRNGSRTSSPNSGFAVSSPRARRYEIPISRSSSVDN